MLNNLLELFARNAGPALIEHAYAWLPESRQQINQGLGAMGPILLGRLLQTVSGAQAAQGILDLMQEEGYDGSYTAQLDQHLGASDSYAEMLSQGSHILRMLLNDKSTAIVDQTAEYAGISRSTTTTLFSLSSHLMMDQLGKVCREQKLDRESLYTYLQQHAPLVRQEMPEQLDLLSSTLHFYEFPEPASSSPSSSSLLLSDGNIALVLGALCLLFGLLAIRSCWNATGNMRNFQPAFKESSSLSKREEIRQKAMEPDSLALPLTGRDSLRVAANSAPGRFARLIRSGKGGTLTILSPWFQPNSSVLNELALKQLPVFVSLLKATPATRLLISSGDRSPEISQQQSLTLKKFFTDNGLEEKRIRLVEPNDKALTASTGEIRFHIQRED
jgi:hypothetical protein